MLTINKLNHKIYRKFSNLQTTFLQKQKKKKKENRIKNDVIIYGKNINYLKLPEEIHLFNFCLIYEL